MSIAGRHGKLHVGGNDDETRWRRIEDLLTADVFGAFRYLPPELGVVPFLAGAATADGLTLAQWMGDAWRTITHAEIAFWPSVGGCQPDLLVALRTSDGQHDALVLIEAKHCVDLAELADADALRVRFVAPLLDSLGAP